MKRKFKLIWIKVRVFFLKLKYGKRIKIGKKLEYRGKLRILIDKNGYLEIGDNCFFNNDCSINCLNKIILGTDNICGENVKFYDHNHAFSYNNIEKNKFKTNPVVIGSNNWIASNVVVLSKAKLGNNNIIGAGVILNKEISDNIIVRTDNITETPIRKK